MPIINYNEEDNPANIIRQQIEILENEDAEAAWRQRPEGVEVTFNTLWDQEEAVARGELKGIQIQALMPNRFKHPRSYCMVSKTKSQYCLGARH